MAKAAVQKRCSTKAMSHNIAHLIRDSGYPQKRAVAASYSILKRACRCALKARLTPKQIVACGKRGRKRRGIYSRGRRICKNGPRS